MVSKGRALIVFHFLGHFIIGRLARQHLRRVILLWSTMIYNIIRRSSLSKAICRSTSSYAIYLWYARTSSKALRRHSWTSALRFGPTSMSFLSCSSHLKLHLASLRSYRHGSSPFISSTNPCHTSSLMALSWVSEYIGANSLLSYYGFECSIKFAFCLVYKW